MNGDKMLEDHANFYDHTQELDAEDLVVISGAGLGNVVKGWKAAGNYGGNLSAKVASAWHGMTHSSQGSSLVTKEYALVRAQKDMPASVGQLPN